MKTIAFDVMGNDNGVKDSVQASLTFVKINTNYKIILVGNKNLINKYTKGNDRLEIIDIKKTVNKSKGAFAARKDENSMSVAINLVKNKKADLVISSGDSGIYLSMSTILLGRMKNIKRPAFMPIFPSIIKGKRFICLDVGANLDSTSEMLTQWAKLGNVFSNTILKVKTPRVGIVNIGTEENKGKDFHIETYNNLKKDNKIKFVGFVEPRDLLNNVVDVAVTDGYAGNMVLKTMEGTLKSLLKLIKTNLKSSLKNKIGALLSRGAYKEIKETLDHRKAGAAWVIGLNGLALKAHGNADLITYNSSLNQAKIAIEKDILKKFKGSING